MSFTVSEFKLHESISVIDEASQVIISVLSPNDAQQGCIRFTWRNQEAYYVATDFFYFDRKKWTGGKVPSAWKEEYFEVVDKLRVLVNRKEII
jgi:hypothetical protein